MIDSDNRRFIFEGQLVKRSTRGREAKYIFFSLAMCSSTPPQESG